MANVHLTVRDVSAANRRHKYLLATKALAKALGVPITFKQREKEDEKERSAYQIHDDLVQKWVLYFAGILDQAYKTICNALDMPLVTTFSKAIDDEPLIWKGKILYSPETGQPISMRQWKEFIGAIEKFLNRKLDNAGQRIVLDAVSTGRILNRMLKYNTWEAVSKLHLQDAAYRGRSLDWISEDIKNLNKLFPLSDYDLGRLQIAQESAAQYVRSASEDTKKAIRQTLMRGIIDKKSKSEVAQELFDKMGSLNRDWQRIVETEVADNMNTAFLKDQRSMAEPGEKLYYQRIEVLDKATCPHCRKINGVVALWSDVPLNDEKIDDPYAKIAIWEGKTRVGRKANDNWVAAGAQHPWCYSDDTEVLTDAGWMLFKDLTGSEKIMAINPDTLEVGFVGYTQKIAYHYTGEMIHFNGLNYDMLVTPDHHMLFTTRNLWKQKILKEEPAKDIIKRAVYYLPMAIGEWAGTEPPKTIEVGGVEISYRDYVRLWAWFLSEGNTRRREIKLTQKFPGRITNDLPSMAKLLKHANGAVYLYGAATEHFKEYIGVHAEQKYIPDFIKNLTPEYIREFLDAFSLGDGSHRNGQHHAKSYSDDSQEITIRTSSPKMMADMCELIVKAGWMPSVWVHRQKGVLSKFKNGSYVLKTNCYNINIKKSKFRHYFAKEKPSKNGKPSHAPKIIQYDGMVYDVELEKWHFLLVKRNGKVAWSGNCRGSWARWTPPGKKEKVTTFDAAMAKLKGQQKKWGEAVDKAKQEFAGKGIKNPSDKTPGYMERINELYNS